MALLYFGSLFETLDYTTQPRATAPQVSTGRSGPAHLGTTHLGSNAPGASDRFARFQIHGLYPPGRRLVNAEPLPGPPVAATPPPMMRGGLRGMARRTPVPRKRRAVAASAWLNSSNSRACCSAVMPMPVSTTASSIPLPRRVLINAEM